MWLAELTHDVCRLSVRLKVMQGTEQSHNPNNLNLHVLARLKSSSRCFRLRILEAVHFGLLPSWVQSIPRVYDRVYDCFHKSIRIITPYTAPQALTHQTHIHTHTHTNAHPHLVQAFSTSMGAH
jgi:hypothetical protein